MTCHLYSTTWGIPVSPTASLYQTQQARPQAWISSLLFALHPIHVEPISNVTGRADVLSTFFVLIAVLLYSLALSIDASFKNCRPQNCDEEHKDLGIMEDSDYDIACTMYESGQIVLTRLNELYPSVSEINLGRYFPTLVKQYGKDYRTLVQIMLGNRTTVAFCSLFLTFAAMINAIFSLLCKELGFMTVGICLGFELLHFICVRKQNPVFNPDSNPSLFTSPKSFATSVSMVKKPKLNEVDSFMQSKQKRSIVTKRKPTSQALQEVEKPNSDKSLEDARDDIFLECTLFPHKLTKTMIVRVLIIIFMGSIIALVRFRLTDGTDLNMNSAFNNMIRLNSTTDRFLSIVHIHAQASWLLIFPYFLAHQHNGIPPITSIEDLRNIYGLILWLFMIWYLFSTLFGISRIHTGKRNVYALLRNKRWLFFMGWMVVSYLPSSHIFFFVGFLMAERIMYMPSVGFCLLLSDLLVQGFDKISTQVDHFYKDKMQDSVEDTTKLQSSVDSQRKRKPRFRVYFLYTLLLLYMIRVITRNFVWRTHLDLVTATTKVYPDYASNPKFLMTFE